MRLALALVSAAVLICAPSSASAQQPLGVVEQTLARFDRDTLRTASGRVLWRSAGSAGAVAAGRVYALPAVLDLATGARVGTHPKTYTLLRLL